MTRTEYAPGSQRLRVVLLAAQAFALGLTIAWIVIPASAIFLSAYGSGLLPVTYIGAGVAGVVSNKSLAGALHRRPLASVATRTLAGFSALLLTSWFVSWKLHAEWVSFGLLVLVPILVPVGFILVVGQAGMLLDVRSLKALYPRVVAGFALGFVAGGVAGAQLLVALGRAEHLLAAASGAAAIFLILLILTRRSFPSELSVVAHGGTDSERATLRGLLRNRYVLLIMGFQMLSAVESQWLDFLVFDRAARRYHDSRQLAQFVSRFSAIAYGADILFLLVLAGVLLRRLGLRYGLTANATGVLALVAAMIVAASLRGSGATVVFVLVVAARVTDLVFSDGTSRTSLSAAYQVVPTPLRTASQTAIEGLAVPVAIGTSGVVLLVVRASGKIDGSLLAVLTGLVVTAWVVVAMLLYREYRVSLLASLRRRTLSSGDLIVDVENSLKVIDRLVESEDERDVRLGLDILTTARHPGLLNRLQHLAVDERAVVRVDAIERLLQLDARMAAAAARNGLGDPSALVRSTCIRVLGTTAERSDVAEIVTHSADSSAEVRVAVAAALSRAGDDTVRQQVAAEISDLSRARAPNDRLIAAQMLTECASGSWLDRTPLQALLSDPDHRVVSAALEAIRFPEDSDRLGDVAVRLNSRRSAGAAVEALVRGGDAALAAVDRGLHDPEFGRRGHELLTRVGREIGGSSAMTVLRRHVEHPDREVGLAVMTAISALGPSGVRAHAVGPGSEGADVDPREVRVMRIDLEHAARILRALLALDDEPPVMLLRAGLRDELELIRQRMLAWLSMRHGAEALNRVALQLDQPESRSHALAFEWLDVTLTGSDRAALAILEPGLSDRERMSSLTRTFPIAPLNRHEVLHELIEDGEGRWKRPWIKACAIYAAAGIPGFDLDAITATVVERSSVFTSDDEAGIVRETLAGIRQRRRDAHE